MPGVTQMDLYSTQESQDSKFLSSDKCIRMVNFVLCDKCERWVNLHDMSMGQRKNPSPRQESNPWPPEHQVGVLSTELRELVEIKVIFTEFTCDRRPAYC